MRITGLRRNSWCVKVTRQRGDPRLRSESELFVRVRDLLQAKGRHVIKRRMCKDGCQVSSDQYWVRSRTMRTAGGFSIHWHRNALECAHQEYNREGAVYLLLLWWPKPKKTTRAKR